MIVKFQGTYLSKKTRIAVDRILEWLKNEGPRPPAGLDLGRTGSAAVGRDTNVAATQSIKNTTYATIGLVVLILLIVYRSPLLAMIPLITIVLSVMVSLRLIALLTFVPGLGFKVINITQVFVIVVLFGRGPITASSSSLVTAKSCTTESREKGRSTKPSPRSVPPWSQAPAPSSSAWACFISPAAKVKYTGPTIALSLAVALVAALTLAPALLALFGKSIFWPFQPHLSGAAESGHDGRAHRPGHGFWGRVADLVIAQPLPILAVCLLVLLPLAAIGARVTSAYSQLSDLDRDTPSVLGTNTVRYAISPSANSSPAAALLHHSPNRLSLTRGPRNHRHAESLAPLGSEHRRGSLAHSAAR